MANEYDKLLAPAVSGNPYDDVLRGERKQTMRVNMMTGVDANPDTEARVQDFARRYNLPAEAVRLELPQIERRAKVEALDYDTLARLPATAKLLESPEKAKLVHDDVTNLQATEDLFWQRYATGQAARGKIDGPAYQRGDWQAPQPTATARASSFVANTGSAMASSVPKFNEGAWGLLRAGGDLLPDAVGDPVAGFAARMGGVSRGQGDRLMPKASGLVEASWYSGMQSFGLNMLQLPLAFASGGGSVGAQMAPRMSPMLASMGLTTGGQAYGEARDKGVGVGQSLAVGASQGVIESGTEMIGMPALFSLLKPGKFGAKALEYMIKEQGGEQLATHLQDLNEWAVLNPEKSFADYLQARPNAALQTALSVAFGGGAQVATMKGVGWAMNRAEHQQFKAQQAQASADMLGQLTDLARASKVSQRDPATFEEFIAEASAESPVNTVFVDAQALMQSGMGEVLMQVSPSIAAQLPEAAQTGGTVAIPVSEYAARIAPTEHASALQDLLRTEADGFSRAEAQAWLDTQGEQLQQELDRAAAEAENADAFRVSADAVRETIKTQLTQAGVFRDAVNDAYAAVPASFYAVTAAKLGVTPEQLYQQYPLTVGAQLPTDAAVLNQFAADPQTDTPEFKRWFGGSKVVDAQGKPMVVYHGTRADFSTFDPDMIGDNYGVDREGFFFTNNTIEASGYADPASEFVAAGMSDPTYREAKQGANVMPVYLNLQNPLTLERYTGDLYTTPEIEIDEQGIDLTDYFDGNRRSIMAFANERGHDGVLFERNGRTLAVAFRPEQIKSAIGNNGTFDANDPNILHQGPLGTYNPATLNIAILKGADLSTFLHETGHHFLEMQLSLSAQLAAKPALTEGEQSLVNDGNVLLQWFGVRDIAEWQNMPFEEKRAHHETFARGFEAYLYEGRAPSIELQGLFQRFRAWLVNVYRELKNLNVELTPAVRGVMDRMLASGDEIMMAEQARGMMPSFETAEQAGMTQAEWAEYQQQDTQATQDAVQDLQARGLRDMQWLANARGREVARLKRESAALRRQTEMQVRRELMNEPVYRAWAFLTGKITEEDAIPKPPPPPKTGTTLNPEVDSLLPAIAKLGGIARASAGEHLGVHKDDFRVKSGVFGATVFRAGGGLSADAMADRLVEQGYLTPDEHGRADLQQLEEKIGAELIGDNQYSVHHDWANAYGEMRAGEQAANLGQLGAGRLDAGALQEMYGKSGGQNVDWARLTTHRMTSKNGLHPDIVADLLTDDAGAPLFTSGDHLVHALLEAQPLAEAVRDLTDARMLQEHGELATPQAIASAADAAIHNAARARFVATEANALAKASGRPRVLNEAARAYAEQAIARHKLRELQPSRYSNAETKAAKASAKAMKAGDLAVAAAEKRNQLIQNHLARAAHQAREQGAKDVRYLRKFDKRSKTLDAEYADQIDALLDRFDLRDRSLRAIDRAKSLRQWYDEQVAQGLEPDIPDALLDEASRKSWKDMTVEEFRGLVDTVRQIEHLGRLKHRLLTAADKRAFDAIATDAAQAIRDNGGAVRQQPLERERGLGGLVRQFRADHRKFASLLRQMDGGTDNGLLWNLLGREMNDRGTQEAVANERATEALMALYKPMLALKGGLTGEKVFIPAIGDSLTRGGRLAVALNWGNADNRQRLMSGRGWNEAQVNAVLGTLSRDELAFVNGAWEYLDSFWPEIAAKEKRLTGVEPERVQAAPFMLALADGSQVEMRGGYYPIKYDPTQSDRAAAQDAAQIADEMKRGAFTRATTRRGHTKARTAEVKGRPLLLDLSVITQHVSQVNHDLAWHEWLVDANRLLADRRITSAIRDHYGHETLATMKNHLEAIATGDLQTQDAIDRAMLYLRGAVSRSTMGLSLTTALMQPFGITQSMARVGPKWVIQGMGRWVGDAARFESSMTWIAEKSDFMRLRNKTFNRELSEINGRVTHGKGKLRTMADASLFCLIQKMQLVADVPTWIGAYEKAQAEGHDEARSVALADQAVIDSQGGGQTKDLSAVQRDHPFMTMFYGYFSSTYNLAAESTAKTDFRNPAAVAGWMGDMALLMVIPALAPNLLMALLRGEAGDDDWWDKLPATLAKWQAGYLLSTMVGVREISGLIEGFAYSGPPAGRVLVDAGKLVTQVKQGDVDEGLAAAAVRTLGSVTGIPSTQIVRSARGWSAWADGDAPVTSVLVGPPPPKH